MSECSEWGFGQFRTFPYPGEGGAWLAEGIFVKNKGDQEFSYIFDGSANGFQQTTPQKPCPKKAGVAYYE